MKRTHLIYWILTGLLIPTIGIGSIFDITSNPESVKIITALGYPAYLTPFLGLARILALIALFTPKFTKLKEWAYAGLVFDTVGAIYSQIALNNPITNIIFPVIVLALIFGSYFYHRKRIDAKNN